MKRLLPFAALLFLVACVDTSGLSAESSRPPQGNADAVVTVTEFADLQCSACRTAHASVNVPLLGKYGAQVRFDFLHFPLQTIHRHALAAAEAAECAADQGKFWEYVDLVYREQDALSRASLKTWAQGLGFDMELFGRCTRSRVKRATILADYEEGRRAGVRGTPTYFVNGKRTETGLSELGAAIDAVIGSARQKL